MNYSPKKSEKAHSEIAGGIVKALFVMVAALWFCNSAYVPAKDAAVSAEIVTVEMPTETSPVHEMTAATEENDEEENDKSDEKSFINPTEGVLTSEFGPRGGRNHNGIDIGGDTGTEIYAAAGGEVTCADVVSGYGNYIVIDHKNGYETAYAHCDEMLVSEGETVLPNQLIAYMGSTGNSTGPHLHFEVKYCGEFCDPLDFVVY